jgi:hypothetical protein
MLQKAILSSFLFCHRSGHFVPPLTYQLLSAAVAFNCVKAFLGELVLKHSPAACWTHTDMRCKGTLSDLVTYWMENQDGKGEILPKAIPGYILLVMPVAVLFCGHEYDLFRGAQTEAERAADPCGRFSKFENGQKTGTKRTGADGSMKHKASERRAHAATLAFFFQIMAASDSLCHSGTPLMNKVHEDGRIVSEEGLFVDAATVGATDPNALSRFLSSTDNLKWAQWIMQIRASKKTLPVVKGGATAKSRFVHIKTFCKVLQSQITIDKSEDFGGFSPNVNSLALMSKEDASKRRILTADGESTIAYVFEVSCHQ